MKFWNKTVTLWRDFFRRRRFVMQHATDNTEEWHIHLSPAGIVAGSVSLLLMLFILVLSLTAYTPVLEMLPGYRTEANRSRESLARNIIRIDSMERVLNDMLTYNRNIAMIMAGKSPVARMIVSADSTRTSTILVMPSAEDSLLRAQMEGEGPYSLAGSAAARAAQLREQIELTSPVEGIVAENFNIEEGRFGIRLSVAPDDRVTAIDNGTVIASLWSPDGGNQLVEQHLNNLIAIYKNLSQPLVTTGQAVRTGELIGHTAAAEADRKALFELELWNNGRAVDPEGYIVF